MSKPQQLPRDLYARQAQTTLPTSQEQRTEVTQYLDPRAALLAFIADLVGLLVIGKPAWLLSEAGIAVALALLCGAGSKLMGALRALFVFLLIIIVASWWEGGSLLVIIALARVMAFVAWAAAFFEVAPPENVVESLQQWGLPLQVAFVVSAGLRFVPLVAATYQELRDAQEARGIRFTPFWRHVNAYIAILVPLLREIFRFADQLAQAMESRGFSATPRTSPARTHWHAIDILVVLLSVSGTLIIILFGR